MGEPSRYQAIHNGHAIRVNSHIGEELLAIAYLRMQQEGLLEYMFWKQPPSLREFLNWACATSTVVVIGGFVDGELAGLGWVREIQERGGKRFADTGEVIFRQYQAMGVSHEIARLMLDFAFQEVKAEALYGITPAKNIPAVRFMRHMGFGHTCEVPHLCSLHGEICGGYISWMTREMWEKQREEQCVSVSS